MAEQWPDPTACNQKKTLPSAARRTSHIARRTSDVGLRTLQVASRTSTLQLGRLLERHHGGRTRASDDHDADTSCELFTGSGGPFSKDGQSAEAGSSQKNVLVQL